jgi:predicted nucleic acid-binding protein
VVLADTSVWIRSLRAEQPFTTEFDWLLSRKQIAGHALIYGELVIGDRGGRTKLLSLYERLLQIDVVPHEHVVAFVRRRSLNGRGIGWIDAHLLASSVVNSVKLWTADTRLATLANELDVGYSTHVI